MDSPDRKLYRIRKTCFEMLEDRNYQVISALKNESFEAFQARFEQNERMRSRMMLVATRSSESASSMIIIFFADETKKTGVKPIRELTEKMEEKGAQRAILVTQTVLTAFARDAIHEAAPRLIIEYFMDSELLVNITKHELVPRHVPLSNEEKQSLLQRYIVKDLQLPRIQASDPVARYYGLSKGQVVKIIRPSETAGRYVTYRLVV